MHSTVIIVESMSATISRFARPSAGCTTTSAPNSPTRGSSTARAARRSPANGTSHAHPGSTHVGSPGRKSAAASAATQDATSSPSSLCAAITVAMSTSDPSPGAALPPLAIIAGPTASGKSGLALALAEITGGIVINADSAQVYRDLRIVSARPSAADEARAPHRLYGTRDGADPCSAAAWAADARAAIAEAHASGRLPILVGGTGLYLRALLDGIAPIPEIDAETRAAVRAAPVADNHRALLIADPAAAARLRPADSQRIARALEVVRATGRPIADWQARRHGGIADRVRISARVLLPPRDWLLARTDARFATMMQGDGPAEVAALLARGLDPALPVMTAIGVREIGGFIAGALTREDALAAGQAATRRYAKRQYTWFRNQSPPDWARLEEALGPAETAAEAGRIAMLLCRPKPESRLR